MTEVSLDSLSIPQYVELYENSLSFVQKLMFMLFHAEAESAAVQHETAGSRPPISWGLGGKAIIIHNREELVSRWLPLFFKNCSKYQSFRRNLYRWGFKRIPLDLHPDFVSVSGIVECYGNRNFQRNNTALLHHMENLTAEKKRLRQPAEGSDQPSVKEDKLPVLSSPHQHSVSERFCPRQLVVASIQQERIKEAPTHQVGSRSAAVNLNTTLVSTDGTLFGVSNKLESDGRIGFTTTGNIMTLFQQERCCGPAAGFASNDYTQRRPTTVANQISDLTIPRQGDLWSSKDASTWLHSRAACTSVARAQVTSDDVPLAHQQKPEAATTSSAASGKPSAEPRKSVMIAKPMASSEHLLTDIVEPPSY